VTRFCMGLILRRFVDADRRCGPPPQSEAKPAVDPQGAAPYQSASRSGGRAQVAELVDALASGASGLTAVKVRVLSWAPPSSRLQSLQELEWCQSVALA